MDKKVFTMSVAECIAHVEEYIDITVSTRTAGFTASTHLSNELAAHEQDMYKAMFRHELLAAHKSYINKAFDLSKKELDTTAAYVNADPNAVAGQTTEIYDTNGIKFSKKQNNPTTTLSTTDLLVQLARLGVEKSVVDKAVEAATKEKRGNTYYIIEAV